MGLSGITGKYLSGAIKAGVPFAIINSIVLFIIYSLWMALSRSFYISSMADIPGNPVDPSDAARAHWQIPYILLALALCPIIIFITTTLAGAASAYINKLKNKNDAMANGVTTGIVMWAIIVIGGVLYLAPPFVHMINVQISDIPRYANDANQADMLRTGYVIGSLTTAGFAIFPLSIILLILGIFSHRGTGMFIALSSRSAISTEKASNMPTLRAELWSWAKTSIATLVVLIWPTVFLYAGAAFFFNLY